MRETLKTLFGVSDRRPDTLIDPCDPGLAANNRRLGLWITFVIAASLYSAYLGRWLIYPVVFKK